MLCLEYPEKCHCYSMCYGAAVVHQHYLYNTTILLTTTIHLAGLHHAAYLLAHSRFVRPWLGWHVAFAPDLLARLASGGT